ncbi:uncharacterized protein cubi_02454 [Cryptosporidium ubiquitum]|uniref:Uncharacterized protein n=1 Tax=Cryptosporidium ubiquitum TaxID=857276 RepID=A0A1J4MG67_9CRYT|nr:uncharacterized protein cubi_02454 [Cryptosporidium ubiquitum]OII73222.1 hypothetical protein cubi_02454 [Cryptosporidium ubiquitum]
MSDVSENTLRIIKAANRSLQFHQDRLGKAKITENQENRLRKCQNTSGIRNSTFLSSKSRQKKPEKKVEATQKKENDQESIEKTQEKIRELEDRISKILEYSSVLEKTLKQSIDQTNKINKSHCCCNELAHSSKMNESKINSLMKSVVNSLNWKKIQPQVKPCIIRPKLLSKPNSGSLISTSLLESLSNSILELCIEDILISLDTSLHNFSVKFVKENSGAETIT